ncbi:hypothetical protein BCR39DRAFT_588920 [Naematelia encephala]|uniref:Uncharacterized protein n=1 Tax=Naematelia encephala TaxID=71784 RepID=A0A1Y2AZM3_9TREE|nr:hypothetical protein BCR39DRAFT_588920 [Naematelia encephala]
MSATPTTSTPPAFRRRNLGFDPNQSSTSTPTTSFTDLFPSASSTDGSQQSSGGTNVYYLVFLGVLIILLLLAACLAYRAFRIRRRYRTAAQLAIARGQAPPPMNDQYWGLGRFSGWTPDGLDRFGGGTGWLDPNTRGTGGGRWVRVPELWEAEVGSEDEKQHQQNTDMDADGHGDVWQVANPLAVQSLLSIGEPLLTPDEPSAPVHQMGPRPHPPSSFSLAGLAARRRRTSVLPEEPVVPPEPKEQDREFLEGEPVRVALVIQMPLEAEEARRQRNHGEEEDEVGWNDRMELAVWEGIIGAQDHQRQL